MKTDDILFIDTPSALASFCRQLAGQSWLAVDTEFLREKTYYPRLCLIQVATPERCACIDPLALDDLEPLFERLYDPSTTVVMHAAHQDLEIFHHLRGELPPRVFDTQLAAPLLGHPEQMGYARLVEHVLGVSLPKTHSRADWTRRPLPQAQLRYAADDVVYLARLYPKLRAALEARGRLAWLEEDFAELSRPGRYQTPPEQAWRKIRAAEKLKDVALSVLQHLAAWRERTARASDIPRNWLLRDDVLLDLARQQPDSLDELKHIRDIREAFARRHGKALIDLIQRAAETPPEPLPARQQRVRATPEQEALVDALHAVVQLRASENELSAASLGSRKDLLKLVSGERDLPLLHGWRHAMVGRDLLRLLAGQTSLTVAQGRLELVDARCER